MPFLPEAVPRLRSAVSDLSWLLSRGYADKSALKIVGDRYNLLERQRIAVMRCSSSDAALALAMLQRAEQSLSEQKELLQAGVLQLTNELARVIAFLLQGSSGTDPEDGGRHRLHRQWRRISQHALESRQPLFHLLDGDTGVSVALELRSIVRPW